MVAATRSRRFNFLVMLMVSKVHVLGKDLFRLELTMVEKGSFNIPGKVPNRYLSSCCRYGYIVCYAGEAGEVGIYIIVRQGSAVLNRILPSDK